MDLIPDFIKRKQGKVPIVYELPELEPILKDTYGVIVYQEQVMAIANKVAGFSLGQADILRRAMGKKKPEEMEKLRVKFLEGAKAEEDRGEESRETLRIDPEICRLRLQQVACGRLRRRLLSDRLSEGALSDRIHGGAHDERYGQSGQDRRLLHRMPRSRHQGPGPRRE